MNFEDWFAEKWAAFDSNGSMAGALRESWQAGAEQMREKSALEMVKEGEHEYADMIRNLPVVESSRAPEGSQP